MVKDAQKHAAVHHTYVDDGFARLMHVCDDAVRQYQQNKVISTGRPGVRRHPSHIDILNNAIQCRLLLYLVYWPISGDCHC